MQNNPNLEILETTVHRLGSLADKMVFLGGCATGLLLTDPAAPPIRVTQDVDVIVEVASLVDYHRLAKRLRERGFAEDFSYDAPICRWKTEGAILDVMPTDPQILSFGNQWFAPAFAAAENFALPSGIRIRLLPAPYFLATKLEAFDYRGNGDYLLSRDMEDIVMVLDGRPEIVSEVKMAESGLKNYLAKRFFELLRDRYFIDALPGHLPPDVASQARLSLIIDRMKAIAKHQ
ncbi:MAG: hypothetical protein JRJ73_15130 [Deltaproteobacteria bacterium]|nr:hypothetical protein [Deltaproteobacteria bacterium]